MDLQPAHSLTTKPDTWWRHTCGLSCGCWVSLPPVSCSPATAAAPQRQEGPLDVDYMLSAQAGILQLLTFKLHLVVHHLPDQELCMGSMAYFGEFYIERVIQKCKRAVLDRSKHSVELTFWKCYLEELTLRSLAQDYPRHVRSYKWQRTLEQEPCVTRRRAVMTWDRDDSGSYCMGGGLLVEVGDEDDVGFDAVLRTMRAQITQDGAHEYRTIGWPVGNGDELDAARAAGDLSILLFARARLTNQVDLGSCADGAQKSSGRWTYHEFAGNRRGHMCKVEHILKIEGKNMRRYGTDDGWDGAWNVPQPVRFAICTTWTCAPCREPGPGVSVLPGIQPELLRVSNVQKGRAQRVWSAVNIDYLTETCAIRLTGTAAGRESHQGLFMRTGKGVGAW